MFSNFIKITLRNLYREKMYASINIAGLSLAVACFLMLGLYLRSELTYDRHNTKHGQIFRVVQETTINGKTNTSARTSRLLAPMLMEDYAEIKKYVRLLVLRNAKVLLTYEDKAFYWSNACFANPELFDVFDFEIIYGEKPKGKEFTAVSETFARKYFGDENPIGKAISSEGKSVPITLVYKDMPENTHLKYDVVYSDYIFRVPDDNTLRRQLLWINSGSQGNVMAVYTYLLMSEGYDREDFKTVSEAFYDKHMAELGKARNMSWRAWLQPLADIHLKSDVDNDLPTGNMFYLYGFATVAVFILLVACINYMNLATARAARRAKEIGMRKILGSGKKRLMGQFLCEAVVLSLLAMFLGLVFVEVALKLTPISNLFDKHLILNLSNEPQILMWLFAFSLVMGLIAGIYPALYLSSILPLSALVSNVKAGKASVKLRQLLVLIQFIISVTVIASTLLMALQMYYVSNKSLGFDKENRLLITLRGTDLIAKVPTIKNEILQNSNIVGAALCSNVIGKNNRSGGVNIENKDGVPEIIQLNHLWVGDDFVNVMSMELMSGRDFSKRMLTDVGDRYIVNEAMVGKMGWENPIGKRIGQGRIIGVVKDFHYDSMHKPVEPFALQLFPGIASIGNSKDFFIYLVLNISGNEIPQTLNFLEDKFTEFDPEHPFEFEFLDTSINELYLSERKLMELVGLFAIVCIFISCMGLFGLAALTTEQRTKEIGIRKVLGSSTWGIISMLARNIILIVIGGSIIASLIAYYVMDEWLADFAYRTSIDIWVFFVSTAVAACVAFITVALQSYKTAQANPVNALHYE